MINSIRSFLNLVKNVVFACNIVFYYSKVVSAINTLGVDNIKIFKFTKYHHGFYYFTGTLNDQKVFVKVDTKINILVNDVLAFNIGKAHLNKYLVDVLNYKVVDSIEIVVFEFVKGVELTKEVILRQPELISDLCDVIFKINALGMIHRDVKLDNFLVYGNQLKVIDFTFANSLESDLGFKDISLNSRKNCRMLKMLGGKFKPMNYEWNDFFSLEKILQGILSDSQTDNQKNLINKSIIKLSNNVSGNSFSIKCRY
jgi:serine/threonine protein kinase